MDLKQLFTHLTNLIADLAKKTMSYKPKYTFLPLSFCKKGSENYAIIIIYLNHF